MPGAVDRGVIDGERKIVVTVPGPLDRGPPSTDDGRGHAPRSRTIPGRRRRAVARRRVGFPRRRARRKPNTSPRIAHRGRRHREQGRLTHATADRARDTGSPPRSARRSACPLRPDPRSSGPPSARDRGRAPRAPSASSPRRAGASASPEIGQKRRTWRGLIDALTRMPLARKRSRCRRRAASTRARIASLASPGVLVDTSPGTSAGSSTCRSIRSRSGPGYAAEISIPFRRRADATVERSAAAPAGIGSGDELKTGGEIADAAGPRDRDTAVLERLA